MLQQFKFPSLGSCQKRLLWAHKEVILLLTQPLVLRSEQETLGSFLRHMEQIQGEKDLVLNILSPPARFSFPMGSDAAQ